MFTVIKTTFTTGETSYNVNKVKGNGSQTKSFLKSVMERLLLNVRDGKRLNYLNQLLFDGKILSCEVVQIFDDLVMAKQLVNLQMELDTDCIRRHRFVIN